MADVPSIPKRGSVPLPAQLGLGDQPPPSAPAEPAAPHQVTPQGAKEAEAALLEAVTGTVAPEPDEFGQLASALHDAAVDVQGEAPSVARAATELASDLSGVQSFADLPERFAMDVSLLKGQLVNAPGEEGSRAQRLFEFFIPYAARFVQLAQESQGSTATPGPQTESHSSDESPPRADASANAGGASEVPKEVPLHEAPPAPVQEAQRDFRGPRPQVTQQGKEAPSPGPHAPPLKAEQPLPGPVAEPPPGLPASTHAPPLKAEQPPSGPAAEAPVSPGPAAEPGPAPAAAAQGQAGQGGGEGQRQGQEGRGQARAPVPALPPVGGGSLEALEPAQPKAAGHGEGEAGAPTASKGADGKAQGSVPPVPKGADARAQGSVPPAPKAPDGEARDGGGAGGKGAPGPSNGKGLAAVKVSFDRPGATLQPQEAAPAAQKSRAAFAVFEGPAREAPSNPREAAVEHFTDALKNVGLDRAHDAQTGRDGVAVSRDLLQSRSLPELQEKASTVALRPPPEQAKASVAEAPRSPLQDSQTAARAPEAARPLVELGQAVRQDRAPQPLNPNNPAQVVLPQLAQPMRRVQDTSGADHRDPWARQRDKVLGPKTLWNVLHTLRGAGEDSVEAKDRWNRTVVVALLVLFAVMGVTVILVNL